MKITKLLIMLGLLVSVTTQVYAGENDDAPCTAVSDSTAAPDSTVTLPADTSTGAATTDE